MKKRFIAMFTGIFLFAGASCSDDMAVPAPPPPPNAAPIANAGDDQTVTEGSLVTLVCFRKSGPMNQLVSAFKKELRYGEKIKAGRDYCEAA